FFIGERLDLGECADGYIGFADLLFKDRLFNEKSPPILLLGFRVAAVGFLGLLQKIIREFQRIVEPAFVLVQQHNIELNFNAVGKRLAGLLQILPRQIVLHLMPINLAEPQPCNPILGLGLHQILVLLGGVIEVVGEEQGLRYSLFNLDVVGIEFAGSFVGICRPAILLKVGVRFA